MADNDLLTSDEALAAIQQTDVTVPDDVEASLARIVTAVSSKFDELLGPTVYRDVVDEIDGGARVVLLTQPPAAEITSVLEWSGSISTEVTAEDRAELTSTQYRLDARTGLLWRRSYASDVCWLPGRGNVVVEYSAGRCEDTESVEDRIKEAAEMAVLHVWQQTKGLGSTVFGNGEFNGAVPRSFSIPSRALELVSDLVKPQRPLWLGGS